MKKWLPGLIFAFFCAGIGPAQSEDLRLAVPDALERSGFMQYLVPRFSLKTGVRITRVEEGDVAEMALGSDGTAVFEGLGQIWYLSDAEDAKAARFLDWLLSDIGQNTISSFEGPDGVSFSPPSKTVGAEAEVVFDGDAGLGETVSLQKCGRCHVINETNRMKGMGATPSFALLRGFHDWHTRFATFHLLKPHASFTQIEGVTDAFDPERPPPIVPVVITLDELEALLAYVSGMEPADLGAPLQFQ